MTDLPILSLLTFLPLAGVVFIMALRGEPDVVARGARNAALACSLIVFLLSLVLWLEFDRSNAGFQFEERAPWMAAYGISYHMGVDGISMPFVLLSTVLIPICIIASWTSIVSRVREFMIAFLVMETMLVGTFCALDLVLFYIFFEGVLIPMFLIIGVWGGPRRVYSAFKFFLYTLAGSVLMLVAFLGIYLTAGTASIPQLLQFNFTPEAQIWLWLAFLAAFAVKLPMWPVHTWLPDAHVEAPTAGSVILAGVMLKFGGYGFLRFSLPMLPDASIFFAPLIFALSVIAVIYTSLVALAQDDMKKLIAYSSVAHMAYVTVGAFSMTKQGVEGAIFQMLSHGIVSGALFLIVGVVYDRIHSRQIADYGGLVHRMPVYALIFMIFLLSSVGLPGTGGFVGEFLVLAGIFEVNAWVAALTATGMILGAAYMLYLYRRVIFGVFTKPALSGIGDLNARELAAFAPLVVLTVWMGVYPQPLLNVMGPAVDQLVGRLDAAAALSTGSVLAMLLP
jgi:NADH-quinone oxidoreductase subunit M